jgi:hypothetical protein
VDFPSDLHLVSHLLPRRVAGVVAENE